MEAAERVLEALWPSALFGPSPKQLQASHDKSVTRIFNFFERALASKRRNEADLKRQLADAKRRLDDMAVLKAKADVFRFRAEDDTRRVLLERAELFDRVERAEAAAANYSECAEEWQAFGEDREERFAILAARVDALADEFEVCNWKALSGQVRGLLADIRLTPTATEEAA